MDHLARDLLYGLRLMKRDSGLTALAILALALGIGASSAVFSVVHSVLLRPLPFPDESRLLQIWGSNPDRNIPFHNVSYSDVTDWRRECRSFETMVAYRTASANLVMGEDPEKLALAGVNADFFPMLGARFVRGRGFLPDEDAPGAAPVAVLSYGLWQRRFASDAKVIGDTINLDGTLHTVVGVLPDLYQLPGRQSDLFTPLALPDSREPRSDAVTVSAYARLRPGVTKQESQVELDIMGQRLGRQNPNSLAKNPRVWGLREFVVREVRLSLLVLLGAVGCVLMIACVNVANLLLARSSTRGREMAVRKSMGAGRGRLVLQMLTESALLGCAGGAFGILLAWWGVNALTVLVPRRYPLIKEAAIDGVVLTFTVVISIGTGLLFGVVPALVASRTSGLASPLKEGSRGDSAGFSQGRILGLLVVAEVALALALLSGAGLLIRSFLRLNSIDPGFNPRGVLTAGISLPQSRYARHEQRVAFYRELLQRLETSPGVRSAGVVSALPLTRYNTGTGLIIEGRPIPPRGEAPIVWFRSADAGYFHAMEIPLLRGREFTDRDDANAPPAAIINATLARRLWPGEDPLGRRIATQVPADGSAIRWITIVGVVGDLRHMSLDVAADAEIFWPYLQTTPAAMNLVLRSDVDPEHLAPLLRKAVAAIDKEQPVSQVLAMLQIVSDSIAPRRFAVWLFGIFAAVALVLAAVGIYGVVSFSVTRRIREIGVRMALGARPADILRMVLLRVVAMAAWGVAAGLAAAWALTRLIASLLYGVSGTDPLVFTGVSLLMLTIAALAGYFPARRAARVDPMIALRCE